MTLVLEMSQATGARMIVFVTQSHRCAMGMDKISCIKGGLKASLYSIYRIDYLMKKADKSEAL